MNPPADPTSVYAALAAVAAITTAIQAAVCLQPWSEWSRLKQELDASQPQTGERDRARAAVLRSQIGVLLLAAPISVINFVVLYAWSTVIPDGDPRTYLWPFIAVVTLAVVLVVAAVAVFVLLARSRHERT